MHDWGGGTGRLRIRESRGAREGAGGGTGYRPCAGPRRTSESATRGTGGGKPHDHLINPLLYLNDPQFNTSTPITTLARSYGAFEVENQTDYSRSPLNNIAKLKKVLDNEHMNRVLELIGEFELEAARTRENIVNLKSNLEIDPGFVARVVKASRELEDIDTNM